MILLQRSMVRPSAPWWAVTALMVALCAAFLGLGRWQWQRGQRAPAAVGRLCARRG